jgi:hypothetical protein
MSRVANATSFAPSASEYILDNFEPDDRIAVLVLNREFGEVIQRITSAQRAASPPFQAWLRFKNAHGSEIYLGMNPLRQDAATRTKKAVESIRHVYLDLDHGGPEALKSVEDSNAVPKPTYVLTSSPGKYQVVWKVEDMNPQEAETLLRAMAREFGGDPAATDATRVLRLPGFANKKYDTDFYVRARQESTRTYHLRDFKIPIDSQGLPRHHCDSRTRRALPTRIHLSQSEHDWAFAKRALARGQDPQEIVQQIARYRAADKTNPEDYARRTMMKAQSDLAAKEQATSVTKT